MVNVVLPDDAQRSLAFYLAMEEYMARNYEGEIFFVWQTGPTVIYGRNQVLENEVNLGYCRSHGVEVVHRKSGGGCVYSDMGNIMISCISNHDEASVVFERYLSNMTELLCSLGVHAEKSGRNDILVDGKKVSGNAFRQLPDRSIVHGTLLYSTDFEALEQALMPPVEKLRRHGVESVRQRVGNLQDMISIGADALKQAIVEHFCDSKMTLTYDDVAGIEELMKNYNTE